MKTYTLKTDAALKRYDYLWKLSTDRWAWEYLRRNPKFKADAAAHETSSVIRQETPCGVDLLRASGPQGAAARWGLLFFPNVNDPGTIADAIWSPGAHVYQVEIYCASRSADETCDIFDKTMSACKIAHYVDQAGREFILARGNGTAAQLRIKGLSLLGPELVRMMVAIPSIENYSRFLKAQAEALEIYGNDAEGSEPVWSKTTQMLRDGLIVLDCLDLGLSRRETAAVLYGTDAAETDWNASGHMKDTVRYLITKAEGLRDGGYLTEMLEAPVADYPVAWF